MGLPTRKGNGVNGDWLIVNVHFEIMNKISNSYYGQKTNLKDEDFGMYLLSLKVHILSTAFFNFKTIKSYVSKL